MDKIKAFFAKVKAFFAKVAGPFDTIVQTVRDYPKGTLIVAGVLIVLAKVF